MLSNLYKARPKNPYNWLVSYECGAGGKFSYFLYLYLVSEPIKELKNKLFMTTYEGD